MDFSKIKEQLDGTNQNINNFFNFIFNKLKNFKNLTLGEQISFSSVGAGLLLILISMVMFII